MGNRLLAALMFALSTVYVFATWRLPPLNDPNDPLGPKAFPYLIGILGFIVGAWLLAESARRTRRGAGPAEGPGDGARHHPVAVVAVLGWMIAFYLVLEAVGFVVGGAVFLLGLTAYFNRGRWLTNVLVSVLFPLGVYVAFTQALGITLPAGILGF